MINKVDDQLDGVLGRSGTDCAQCTSAFGLVRLLMDVVARHVG